VQPPLQPVPLPTPSIAHIDIVWPRLSRPVSLLCLSRSWIGLWSHWMDGRSHPCLSPLGCPGCEHERGKRHWTAYLVGWSKPHARKQILALPKRTVEASLILRDPSIDLRGCVIDASREGGVAHGPVRVNVRRDVDRVPGDADEPDILRLLEQVWRVMLPGYFSAAYLTQAKEGDGTCR